MTIVGQLLPERKEKYLRQLRAANVPTLYLARTLQRAAFPKKEFDGGFQPAPVYLDQAFSLMADAELRERVLEAFKEEGAR